MDIQTLRAQLGSVSIPESVDIIGINNPEEFGMGPAPYGPGAQLGPIQHPDREELLRPPFKWEDVRLCRTRLREGCYSFSYRPANIPSWGITFVGTLRVEVVGDGYRISGDLYRRSPLLAVPIDQLELSNEFRLGTSDEEADANGIIPIYWRKNYSSYLKGTAATLISLSLNGSKCTFTLNFDEYDYTQPSTGFAGSFPVTPSRSVHYVMSAGTATDSYTGKAYSDSKELGSVSMRWVSSSFRRAKLQLHRLQGSELPPSVGTQNFRTIFKSAGWDVTVSIDSTELPKPSSLSSQSATSCWSTSNLHRFMQSVPGYDPDELDIEWKAHLVSVPATLGCSRGVMFDSSGDVNDIKREGAATFSHDGFNASHSSNFGTAEDELMKDHPRAFLRSAAHEVGHTFNQIHQSFETGNDNSIMTVTPAVADVLAASGQSFPEDINLGFNTTVRRHLIHQPDPAVRPGAMGFFGSAVSTPEADQIAIIDEATVEIKPGKDKIRLGEPLPLSWSLTNESNRPMIVPSNISMQSLTARISVRGPRGETKFIRPVDIEVCGNNLLKTLLEGEALSSEVTLFYGSEGFAFSEPGTHTIDIVLLWHIAGAHVMTSASADIWVSYPVTAADNDIAAQLLHPCVGESVALGNTALVPGSQKRINAANAIQSKHPACERLKALGLPATKTKKKSSGKKRKSTAN